MAIKRSIENGWHRQRNGMFIEIKHMSDIHIMNTILLIKHKINYLNKYVDILSKEFDKRISDEIFEDWGDSSQ